jgi:Protein of unknown function (DUF1214)
LEDATTFYTQLADRGSRQWDLLKNADGSVDLYFSPTAPKGFETNWIPTVPGQMWFTYLRLYASTEDYVEAAGHREGEIATIKRIPNEPGDFIKRSRQQQAYSSGTLTPG